MKKSAFVLSLLCVACLAACSGGGEKKNPEYEKFMEEVNKTDFNTQIFNFLARFQAVVTLMSDGSFGYPTSAEFGVCEKDSSGVWHSLTVVDPSLSSRDYVITNTSRGHITIMDHVVDFTPQSGTGGLKAVPNQYTDHISSLKEVTEEEFLAEYTSFSHTEGGFYLQHSYNTGKDVQEIHNKYNVDGWLEKIERSYRDSNGRPMKSYVFNFYYDSLSNAPEIELKMWD